MSEGKKQFLQKFAHSLKKEIDPYLVPKMLEGSSPEDDLQNEAWLAETINILEITLGEEKCQRVMLGCACQYNREKTLLLQHEYTRTRDIDKVRELLQAQMLEVCQEKLKLPPNILKQIKDHKMGLAGEREGNIITITKIPKCSHIAEYFSENDPQKKREAYCHCPLVEKALEKPGSLPKNFCYCGAGFYKKLWEDIIQRPVKVTLLKSVINGDEVCQFQIELPNLS